MKKNSSAACVPAGSKQVGRISELVNDIVFLLIGTFASATATMFYLRGEQTFRLCHKLNKSYGMSKEYEPVVKHLEQMTHLFYYDSIISNTIYLIFTYLSDHECFQRKREGTGDGYICGVLYPAWYPINLDYTPWKQIIHLMEFIEIIYIIPKLAGACIFFYGVIVITETRINRLKSFLKNISVSRGTSAEELLKIKSAVRDYCDIVE
ncbi:uncharacterized protein LOC123320945 [Coccinella septempunctata]|uniref:uncharacterized protein LOC123320945 n=1 Tax=Coccinella septempunctata TaxID=41139 RepID=UPI001D0615AA|nr:uncharacterized protein LOC123320945 [Coccinella septempunctata]